MAMSSLHEADQIHTEQLWLRFTLARGGCNSGTEESTLENRQMDSLATWTAFGSQAVLWLLYLKTQDVIALETSYKL